MPNYTKNLPMKTWAYYRGGWSDYIEMDTMAESSNPNAFPRNATSSFCRVVIPITLPATPGATTKNISVSLRIKKASGVSRTHAGVLGILRTEGRSTTRTEYAEKGEQIAEAGADVVMTKVDGDYQVDVPFNFTLPDGYGNEGKTIYLWVMTKKIGSNKISDNVLVRKDSSLHSATLTYEIPYTAVTSPNITTKTTLVAPGGTIAVSWSGGSGGANTSISSYTLKIKKGSASGTELYSKVGISSSQNSFSVNLNGISVNRGDVLYATIQAISSVSGYNGSVNSGQIGKINTLPGEPTVKVESSLLTYTSSASFKVTAGGDNDGQARTLYYKLGSGAYTKFTSPLSFSANSGLASGEHTVTFYTYDGLEYSPGVSKKITANYAPQFASPQINHTYIKDMSGGSSTLATKTTIRYTLSAGSVSSIVVKMIKSTTSSSSGYGAEETVPTSAISLTTSSNMAVIDLSKISSLKAGNYFKFKFQLFNGKDGSSESSWSSPGRRPLAPVIPTNSKITQDIQYSNLAIVNRTTNYYGKKVTFSGTNTSSSAYAQLSEVKIIASWGSSSKSFTASTSGSINLSLDLSTVPAGTGTSFKVQVKDILGQTTTSANIKTLTKSPAWTGSFSSAPSVSLGELKPLSNKESFIIQHQFLAETVSKYSYSYKIKIGSNSAVSITPKISTDGGSTQYATISSETINDFAKDNSPTNKNTEYSAILTVTSTDAFGISASIEKTFKVNFMEAPYFTTDKFFLKHDFIVNRTNIDNSIGTEVPATTGGAGGTNQSKQMFNEGEGIIFAIPRVRDKNGDSDISQYLIYLVKKDITTTSITTINDVRFDNSSVWKTISYDSNLTKNNNATHYFYRYNLPTLSKNEAWYFAIRIKDKTGKLSELKKCNTHIIGCRTTYPSFNTSGVSISKNSTAVKITGNFKITDLGGSATSSGWNISFYKNYPNLQRTGIDNYTDLKIQLWAEIASDPNFKQDVLSSTKNSYNFADTIGKIEKNQNLTFSFEFTKFNGTKVFARLHLEVPYSLKTTSTIGYLSNISSTQAWLGDRPTVAHRPHGVAINTNELPNTDVLVVQNYSKDKRYLRLKSNGVDGLGEIIIDLVLGTIDGAIIKGGTW